MNVILKRRQLILATLVLALGVAVFVNWYYTGNGNLKSESEESDYVQNLGEAKYVNAEAESINYFEEAKLNRDKSDAQALDNLNESLKAVKTGTEEAKSITASINTLNANIKLQKDLESLIKAKVNGECIVTISEDNAQVVVAKGILNENTALQILNIVTQNSKIDPANVSISESK